MVAASPPPYSGMSVDGSAMFESMDRDGNGVLNMRELMNGLSDIGLDEDEVTIHSIAFRF